MRSYVFAVHVDLRRVRAGRILLHLIALPNVLDNRVESVGVLIACSIQLLTDLLQCSLALELSRAGLLEVLVDGLRVTILGLLLLQHKLLALE